MVSVLFSLIFVKKSKQITPQEITLYYEYVVICFVVRFLNCIFDEVCFCSLQNFYFGPFLEKLRCTTEPLS